MVIDLEKYLTPLDVHEANKQDLDSTFSFIITAAVVSLLQIVLVYFLFSETIGGFAALIIHLIIVAALAFITSFSYRLNKDSRFFFLLTLCTLVLGPIGAVGSLVCNLFTLLYSSYAQDFEGWFTTIFPRSRATMPEQTSEDIESGRDESSREYSIIPFMDVMEVGSESQKREALSKISSRFNPKFSGVLRKALSDSSNTIRVQAATVIAKIENAFLDRSQKLDTVAKLNPKDHQVVLARARHYDDYAFTGIIDSERESVNREKALNGYMEYLTHKPSDNEVRLAVGRLLYRDGKLQEAAEWFAKCLQEGFLSPAILGWYMECLYHLGRYEELHRVSTRLLTDAERDKDIDPNLLNNARLWAGSYALVSPAPASSSGEFPSFPSGGI
jgi:hypothetical protein